MSMACSMVSSGMLSAHRHLMTEPCLPPHSMIRPFSKHRRWTSEVISPLGRGFPMRSVPLRGSTNSAPSINPFPRTSPMMDTSAFRDSMRDLIISPLRVTSERKAGSDMVFMTSMPAAMAIWFPRNVPAWAPGPHLSRLLS